MIPSRWLRSLLGTRLLTRSKTRRRPLRATIEILEDRVVPTVTWVNPGSGDWDVPTNWSTGQVPQPGDDVVIDQSGPLTITVQYGDSIVVNSLQTASGDTLAIGGGSLEVSMASQLNGPLLLSGGTLQSDAGLTLANSSNQWSGGTFAGNGGVTNAGTLAISGNENLSTGMENNGTLDFQSDGNLGGGSITNAGTVEKSAGSGDSTITLPFNNLAGGTIEVDSGTLALPNTETFDGASFTAATGAVLNISPNNDNSDWTGTYTGTGGGQIINSGNLYIGAAGAAFDFPAGMFQWTGGQFDSTNSGNYTPTSYILTNTGTLAVPSGNSGVIISNLLNFVNAGTMTLTGGNLNITNASFANQESGVIDLESGSSTNGNATIQNAGSIIASSTGTITVNNVFDNAPGAAIDVESGTLALPDGGNLASGPLTIATGAVLDLNNNTLEGFYPSPIVLSGSFTGTGGGQIIDGTGLNIGASGTSFDFPAGMFQWTGGAIRGNNNAYTLTNYGDLTISTSISTGVSIQGGLNFVNAGTMTLTGGFLSISGAYLTNQDGATLNLLAGSGLSGNTTFANNGTLNVAMGTGNIFSFVMALDNTGTIDVQTGTLNLSETVTQVSGNILTGGTWEADAGATLEMNGTIATNQGTIILNGTSSSFPAISGLATNAGVFELLGGQGFSTAGDLANTGSLTLSSGNTLDVTGNYIQSSAATLTVAIGGTPASEQFGQLAVTGQADLDGTFAVTLANGFGPTIGQSYQVITFASESGSFTTISGLTEGRFPYFTAALNPTDFTLNAVTSAADLAVTSIDPLPGIVTVGQSITIGYDVENLSGVTATGSWIDSIYLSPDETIDGNAVLLGRATHTGDLAVDASYQGTLTVTFPFAAGSIHILVLADSQELVPDVNRANNLDVSPAFDVTAPLLQLDSPLTASIADGQDLVYQLNLSPGQDVQVNADFTTSPEAEFSIYHGATFTSEPADLTSTDLTSTNQQLLIAGAQGGSYFILLQGREGAGNGASFTLQADALSFEVDSVAPAQGTNVGPVTLTLSGSQFTPETSVSLRGDNGISVTATQVTYQDADTLYATFNLSGLTLGTYSVQAADHGTTVEDPSAFTVATGSPGQIVYTLIAPSQARVGAVGTVTITYTNVGGTDVLAPLMLLSSDNAEFRINDQDNWESGSIQLLGYNPSGPAGTLTPGASGTITVQDLPIQQAAHLVTSFSLCIAADSLPINWSSEEAGLRLPTIPESAWPAVFGNFVTNVGTTVGSYHAALAADETYLGQVGEQTSDVTQLLEFEIEKANASFTSETLASVTAADLPAPGMDLVFEQSYLQSIGGRYYRGILGGQGWTTNWDISATTTSTGDVAVQFRGSSVYFFLQSNGSYQPESGAEGEVLTLSNGAYRLLETDGTVYQFNANGTLDYVEDPNGNRITASYNSDGQLSKLTDTNGEYLTLTYNPLGQMTTLTDSNGQSESYGYTGSFLSSYTDIFGTTTYSYVSGGTAAQDGSLSEIAYADNTHMYFTYDAEGRLIDQHRDGGAEDVTFTYLPGGGYLTTDGDGNTNTTLFNRFGETAETIDPLGNATQYQYDANFDLTQVDAPGGITYSYTYDANGNLTGETDPLGNTTGFTYNSNNDLTSYTDPAGNTTSYAYDSDNNLLSVTYANGSTQQYTYNPLGEATQFLDADGNAISSTYNADGLITQETFADGTSYSYTYNAQGNMTSATDAQGNVTTFVYGDAANPDLLTEVEYPDGTWLKFTYNIVGQRTQSLDQTGFTVNYAYDAVGRLLELTDGNGNLIVRYQYDSAGNLIQTDNCNGTFTVYTYDGNRNVLSITNYAPSAGPTSYNPGNSTVNSFDIYTYDALNDILTDTDRDGQWVYSYDADQQLTQAVFTPNTTDPDGLTAQDLQYVYDAAGNRVSETVNGAVTTYTVNDMNEYTSSTTAGAGTTTYQYDADGNLISTAAPGGTTIYSYNELDELTGVNGPGITASYAYDPLGNQVSQTIDGATTNEQIDPTGLGNVVATFSGTGVYNNSGGLTAHYTYGLGLVSQVSPTGAASYYDFNVIGSTIGITDANGDYVNAYAYLPYGQALTVTATLTNPFTFVGQLGVQNDGSGLLNMRARNYNPSTGQFTSPDPIGLLGGDTDLRTYVGNDPTAAIDPIGLMRTWSGNGHDVCLQGDDSDLAMRTWSGNGHDVCLDSDDSDLAMKAWTGSGRDVCLDSDDSDLAMKAWTGGGRDVCLDSDEGESGVGDAADATCGVGTGGSPCPCQCPPVGGPGGGGTGGGAGGFGGPIDTIFQEATSPGDPNDLTGPAGFGAANFVTPIQSFPYQIDFENEPTANAPAQVVEITESLSTLLNWTTFQLGDFGFGGQTFAIPAGFTSYSVLLDERSTLGIYVDVSANFNILTGQLTWTFTSLDPTTMDVPANSLQGFLPPDVTDPEGYGFVSYTVMPKSTLTTGNQVTANATVIFDAGLSDQSSLGTATFTNTIDTGAELTSSVNPLPSSENGPFTVSWTGQDPGGSGIASYDVYVSTNGGAYTLWQQNATATSASFTGTVGDTYSFYSVATDNVGNIQPTPTSSQATTAIPGPVYPANSLVTLAANTIQLGGTTTITLQARDPEGHDETIGGLAVSFALENKTGAKGTFSKVTDNRNGTYTAIFTGTLDGNNTITATINGLPATATAPISVQGGDISLAESNVTVPSTPITAGNTTVVTLQAEYPTNKDEPAGGLMVAFKLGSTKGGQGTFSAVTDHGNGTYTAIFTGTLAGTNTIKASINGKAVTSPAPSITVDTGPFDPATSPVTLSATTMKAGGSVTVAFQPEDAGRNKLILGSSPMPVFTLASGSGTFGPVSYNGKTEAFSATFTTNTTGSYTIVTSYNSGQVTSKQPIINVMPAAINLTNSVVNVSKSSVNPGTEVTVTLKAVDLFGNLEALGLAVSFQLAPGNGKGTFGKVTYAGNGIYQVTFTPPSAGTDIIEAVVGGGKVKSTASLTVG